MIDIVEVLVHWHAGRKKSEVARSLGVDRGTVHKYVAHAESEGYSPGDRIVTVEQWGALVRGWFPELVDAKVRSRTHDAIEVVKSRWTPGCLSSPSRPPMPAAR